MKQHKQITSETMKERIIVRCLRQIAYDEIGDVDPDNSTFKDIQVPTVDAAVNTSLAADINKEGEILFQEWNEEYKRWETSERKHSWDFN